MTASANKAKRSRALQRMELLNPEIQIFLCVLGLWLGLILPLTKSKDPLATVITSLAAVALPATTYRFSPRLRWPLLLLAQFAGPPALAHLTDNGLLVVVSLFSLWPGYVILNRLLYRRQQRIHPQPATSPRRTWASKRYPPPGSPLVDMAIAVIALGGGLVLPLMHGRGPWLVVALFLTGATLSTASVLLPPSPQVTSVLILPLGGLYTVLFLTSDSYLSLAWFASVLLGTTVHVRLRYRRQQRTRPCRREPAPSTSERTGQPLPPEDPAEHTRDSTD